MRLHSCHLIASRGGQIKGRVQQKLESDLLVRIIESFKQIHDPRIRQECLRQLQQFNQKKGQ